MIVVSHGFLIWITSRTVHDRRDLGLIKPTDFSLHGRCIGYCSLFLLDLCLGFSLLRWCVRFPTLLLVVDTFFNYLLGGTR